MLWKHKPVRVGFLEEVMHEKKADMTAGEGLLQVSILGLPFGAGWQTVGVLRPTWNTLALTLMKPEESFWGPCS